jgi:hypothetical protein
MSSWRRLLVCVFAATVLVAPAGGQTPATELGTIHFPTSAKPAAQAPFLTGVKGLFNFEFDIAAEAFQQAQKADPDFALAYWGEAMSFNHPLWAEQDLAAARRAMEKLAATAAARSAKAPAGKERMLVEALEPLFGAGDKLTRDLAYADAMKRIHEKYPDDDEIATFYALALLGKASSSETRSIRARLISSFTRSTIRITPFSRSRRRAPTRRSRRPRRTRCTCRRTSSSSSACGTT